MRQPCPAPHSRDRPGRAERHDGAPGTAPRRAIARAGRCADATRRSSRARRPATSARCTSARATMWPPGSCSSSSKRTTCAPSVARARAGLDQSGESRAEAANGVEAARVAAKIAEVDYDRASASSSRTARSRARSSTRPRARRRARSRRTRWPRRAARGERPASRRRSAALGEDPGDARLRATSSRPSPGGSLERRVDPGTFASPGVAAAGLSTTRRRCGSRPRSRSRAATGASSATRCTVEDRARAEPLVGNGRRDRRRPSTSRPARSS